MGLFDGFFSGVFGLGQQELQNQANYWIAEQNLGFQRERANIEDARYADETAYNRAFAENERAYNRAFAEDERAYNRAFAEDERNYQRAFAEEERAYNRALQQQIFEREDTALERQAASLSKMGINPLSQNMNGLGAGQALTPSSPGGQPTMPMTSSPHSNSPSLSSRGGQALHNDMKYEYSLAPILGMLDTINGIQTGEYNRDKLQLENDRMFLENTVLANNLGVNYTPNLGFKHKYKDSKGKILGIAETGLPWSKEDYAVYSRENAYREQEQKYYSLIHKINHHIYDGADSKLNFLRELSTTDFAKIAEDFVTNVADTYSKIGEDFKKRFGGKSSFADKFYNFMF